MDAVAASRPVGRPGERLVLAAVVLATAGLTYAAGRFARGPEWPERAILPVTGGPVRALAFSPDGHTLAAGNEDGTVVLWNVGQERAAAVLAGHRDAVTCIAFSPDGHTLASGGRDRAIRLWDVEAGRPLAVLAGHADSIHGLAFHPDGHLLASGSEDGSIRLWDVPARRWQRTLSTGCDPVLGLAFRPDGRLLTVSSRTHPLLQTWDPATGTCASAAVNVGTEALAFSPDGRLLAGAAGGGTVRVWDLAAGHQRAYLDPWYSGGAPHLAFRPDGTTLAVARLGGVTFWDTRTGAIMTLLDRPFAEDGTAVAFAPDGSTLAAAVARAADAGPDRHAIRLWTLPRP